MAVSIPDRHKRVLTKPVLANLATIMPDGRPQVHPVWCDYDGTYVRVDAADDRQQSRNMRQRAWATSLPMDPQSPHLWMEIGGRVMRHTTEGTMGHMHVRAKIRRA